MSPASRRLREIILSTGAIAGALCFAVGIATFAFGVTPLVVESGSMSPTIKTGALAIARDIPATSFRVGDIVCIKTGANVSVTHRIVKITHRPGSASIRLKGDANKVPDAQIYTVKHAGLVVFSIPFAGRIVAAASGPIGLLLLGGYMAFIAMILTDERRKRRPGGPGGARKNTGKAREVDGRRDRDGREPPAEKLAVEGRRRRPIGGTRAMTAVALLTGGVLSVGSAPEPTFAAWADGVDVGTSSLSTYTVPVPGNFRCGGLGVASVQFQWNAVAGATNYTLHYGNGGATTMTVTGTSQTITSLISGGTAWVNANQNFGSTTWTSANSNTRTYTVAVVSLCS
jgi:signal peptidase I